MDLKILDSQPTHVHTGYSCPCGCTPSVQYSRGAEIAQEGCCCGNRFAVGPHAAAGLPPRDGFRPEVQVFDAPWGESLEAAWLIGPSIHGPSEDHGDATDGLVIDPVCGMSVDRETAKGMSLRLTHQGVDYFFCGKGCKLEFGDDPGQFLDPSYSPSM